MEVALDIVQFFEFRSGPASRRMTSLNSRFVIQHGENERQLQGLSHQRIAF